MKAYKVSLLASLAITAVSLLFVLFNSGYTAKDFGTGIAYYCSADVWTESSFGQSGSPHYFPVMAITAPQGQHEQVNLEVGVAHAKVAALVISPDLLPLSFLASWLATLGLGLVSSAIRWIRSLKKNPDGIQQAVPIRS